MKQRNVSPENKGLQVDYEEQVKSNISESGELDAVRYYKMNRCVCLQQLDTHLRLHRCIVMRVRGSPINNNDLENEMLDGSN